MEKILDDNSLKKIYDRYSYQSNIDFDSLSMLIDKNNNPNPNPQPYTPPTTNLSKFNASLNIQPITPINPNVKQVNIYLKNKKERDYFNTQQQRIQNNANMLNQQKLQTIVEDETNNNYQELQKIKQQNFELREKQRKQYEMIKQRQLLKQRERFKKQELERQQKLLKQRELMKIKKRQQQYQKIKQQQQQQQQQQQKKMLKNYKFKVHRQKKFSDTATKSKIVISKNDKKNKKLTKKLYKLIDDYKNNIINKDIPLQLQKDLVHLSKNINIRYT